MVLIFCLVGDSVAQCDFQEQLRKAYSEEDDAWRLHGILRRKDDAAVVDPAVEVGIRRSAHWEVPLEEVILRRTKWMLGLNYSLCENHLVGWLDYEAISVIIFFTARNVCQLGRFIFCTMLRSSEELLLTKALIEFPPEAHLQRLGVVVLSGISEFSRFLHQPLHRWQKDMTETGLLSPKHFSIAEAHCLLKREPKSVLENIRRFARSSECWTLLLVNYSVFKCIYCGELWVPSFCLHCQMCFQSSGNAK